MSGGTPQATAAMRRALARRAVGQLEDLDWILETDADIRCRLRFGDRVERTEARALVAARLRMHPQSFDRFLRRHGRSVETLRPSVDSLSTAV